MTDKLVVTPTRRVIYGDTDAMGIVYYGNYMRFFEEGRVEYLRTKGKAYAEIEAAGYAIPVVEVRARYLSPARYDDEVEINTTLDDLGRASITFGYRLTRKSNGEVLVKGFTRHAIVSIETGRAVRVPQEITDLLAE